MKKYIILTTIVILLMVLVLPLVLSLGIRFIPYNPQPELNKTKGVFWKYEISQEFTAQEDNLLGLGMSIKNPNLENKKDITLDLYLGDELIRSSVLNGSVIEDGSFVRFMFDKIVDAKGKKYTLVLSAPDARQEDSLEVFYADQTPEWMGQMRFDEEKVKGGISLVTFHQPQSRVGLIKEIYSQWIERLFSDPSFAVGYGLAIVGLLILIVI